MARKRITHPYPIARAKPMLERLKEFYSGEAHDDWMTVKDMCFKYDSKKETVRKALQQLEADGTVERFRTGQGKILGYRQGPALKGVSP